MIFSTGYSQCTVRDLPDTTQKKILTKFALLDECNELRKTDSTYIVDLRTHNSQLLKDYTKLEKKARRRKRMIFIVGGAGFVGGLFVGLKN